MMNKLILIVVVFVNVACSEFESMTQADWASLSGSKDVYIENRVNVTAGKLDENCSDNSSYDACIIWKNPVAQEGDKLSEDILIDTNIFNFSYYGVQLRDRVSANQLKHNSFEIITANGEEIEPSSSMKNEKDNYVASDIAQLMAYYWGQRTIEVLELRTGYNYLKDADIKVYVNDNFNGWTSALNKIHLGKTQNEMPMALNGEVIVYYFSLANISYANDDIVSDLSEDEKHLDCTGSDGGTVIKGCCKNELGCSKALVSGLAEYQTALVFPESPIFGEGLANSKTGQQRCSLSRAFYDLMEEEAVDVFEACDEESKGDIYLLGSHLAAKLWQLRDQLSGRHLKNYLDVLILASLEELEPEDDFETYFEKLLILDEDMQNLLQDDLEELASSQDWL
ncbi:MAG: hypothetical protein KDD58_07225 [Bdellovibrionales bacterium]|nr:hypothetical protein [Bdellovibrionales bacterium]